MNSNKSVFVRCSLYDYGFGSDLPHPRDIKTPDKVINRRFIPQTMGDSIWLLYEFESEESLAKFTESPGKDFRAARIQKRDQEFFDKWGMS